MTALAPLAPAGEDPPPADLAPAAPPAAANDAALVPLRARHDGWTPARQRAFLEALADYGSVRDAAAAVGMSEATAYRLRRRPDAKGFGAAWDAALALTVDRLAATAVDRALNGTVKRLYYHGELVAEERVHSDRLLMFLIANGAGLFGGRRAQADWASGLERIETGGYRVWRDPMDGNWLTDFPPPRGFRGWEDGKWLDRGYRRELSRAEKRAVAARPEAAAFDGECEIAEAARARFFAGGDGGGASAAE